MGRMKIGMISGGWTGDGIARVAALVRGTCDDMSARPAEVGHGDD